jgi:hypothetical protein
MLTAGGVTAMHVGGEHRSVDTQLTGERGHDLWVGLLADARHPTGKPGITELDGEAELGRAAPMTATDQLEHEAAQNLASEMDLTLQEWSLRYLGLQWWGLTYVMIQLPVGVGLGAEFDPTTRSLQTTITFRPPYRPEQFWVRFGERWDATLSAHRLDAETELGDAWSQSVIQAELPAGEGPVYVWAGLNDEPNHYRWSIDTALGKPVNAHQSRAEFLNTWYSLARKTLSAHIPETPGAAAGSRRNSPAADAFELAIANVFSSLGYNVLFGGTLLQTTGVDFVALDETRATAFAVSVTIGNDVADKVRTWLLVKASISDALSPVWDLRPVIIMAQELQAIPAIAKTSAFDEDVQLITAEQIQCLREEPPDLQYFTSLFALGKAIDARTSSGL